MKRFFRLSMIKILKLKWMTVVSLLIVAFACYPPDSFGPSLNMSKTTYDVNETIVVNYASILANSANWVGIYVAGASNEAYLQRLYSDGAANGTMRLDGLPTAGELATEWESDSDYGIFLDALHSDGVADAGSDGDNDNDGVAIITASGENIENNETKEMAFDGDDSTKWFTFENSGWKSRNFYKIIDGNYNLDKRIGVRKRSYVHLL